MSVAIRETPGPSVREVDAVVRSVLAERLGPTPGRGRQAAGTIEDAGDIFAGRLLSFRHAEALSPEARRVRLAPGTVITPLARDHLRRLGIEVQFIARGDVERIRNSGEWGFVIEARSGVLEAVRRSLLEGADLWREVGRSLDEAIAWVSESAGEGRGALVLTDEASVAVYRACRAPGVRGASATDPVAVARAVRALGVNLLIVEPAGKPLALIRQLASTFRRGGGPVVPDGVRDGLGGRP